MGTNLKKYDSRKDLLNVSKYSASQDVTFATKNKFTSNIYDLCYLDSPKVFGRFPRKHSGIILVYNRFSEQPLCSLTKRSTLPPVFSGEIFENGWL